MTDSNDRTGTFDVIAGYVPGVGGMVMTGADGLAENVTRQWVTAGFFDALGIQPIAGRTFVPDDDRRRANVVVLSETLWRSRFNARPRHCRHAISGSTACRSPSWGSFRGSFNFSVGRHMGACTDSRRAAGGAHAAYCFARSGGEAWRHA